MERIITTEDVGKRLDVVLTAALPDISRSRLQKLIKAGEVTLNGKKVTPHIALKEGDVIIWKSESIAPIDVTATPNPDVQFGTVYEDDDVLVIEKPYGLLVHPAAGENNTLANGLLARYPSIAKVGDQPERPGIVHRLDKDASGLLVVAKTPAAFEDLKKQFQDHVVTKEYQVLVGGVPPLHSGTIELFIGRSSFGGKMAARPEPRLGDRPAVTHYEVVTRYTKGTLLSIRTETGRTHQIRVHLYAIACPVAGDQLYGIKSANRLPCPRLFLHCKHLAFRHPRTGKTLDFTSPLPVELEKYLATLKPAADSL